MKTSELTGAALDWAVAKCEGEETFMHKGQLHTKWTEDGWTPSTDWSQGGPIIERESMTLMWRPSIDGGCYWACISSRPEDEHTIGNFGPTPLIAAMRCFVASKLGNEIKIPKELK
jgi:Protein of unknown function (DUF2591)